MGFPTANIAVGEGEGDLAVADGVYAVRARLGDGQTFCGMANLGRRPSVAAIDIEGGCEGGANRKDRERLLEVNLFGFEGDLYGEVLEVEMLFYIRPEHRFDTLEELREAVEQDREAVKEKLGLA